LKEFKVLFESDEVDDVDVIDALSAIHCRSRVFDNNARWIERNTKILGQDRTALMCSRCRVLNFDLIRDDFCRHCGARMDDAKNAATTKKLELMEE